MKTAAVRPPQSVDLPVSATARQSWEKIQVEALQHAPGECHHCSHDHTVSLSLAPRPVSLVQTHGTKTFSGLYGKGDLCLVPAKTPFFARWDSEDFLVQVQLKDSFVQQVAHETLDRNPAQTELHSEFRTRDPQLESIIMLLLAELQQENLGCQLFAESLANLLAVHLLRKYAGSIFALRQYEGGLPQQQVMQVMDYIHDNLSQEIRLADLAQILGLSQFHFSRMFKQSTGIAPHQYLIQQRVERAKVLLKKTNESIVDIAFACGFNSHSHLSQQFRQLTGITPKAYRLSHG
jgi:AraC family transcriptional regulator